MPNFSPPPPTVTALSKEISLDYGRTACSCSCSHRDYKRIESMIRALHPGLEFAPISKLQFDPRA